MNLCILENTFFLLKFYFSGKSLQLVYNPR